MHGLLQGWNAQVRPIEGLKAMLGALQKTSYTLAVISNTRYAPLVHAMLRHLGAQASGCIYVGDNPADDYAGAVSAGLQPLLIDPAGQHSHVPSERRIPHILGLAPYLAGAAKNQ